MQSSQSPLVSVLIPSYEYAATLPDAISSVLSQTLPDWELILVDDGSRDGSRQILELFRKKKPQQIRILTHPEGEHRGIRETYRLGVSEARGKYLAFLEADDVWAPCHLEKKVTALEQTTGTGLVFSDYKPFGIPRNVLYWKLYSLANRMGLPSGKSFEPLSFFLLRNPAATFSGVVLRRELVRHSDWDGPEDLWADWWLFAHLALRTRFFYDRERTVYWRIHSASANTRPVTIAEIQKLQNYLISLYNSLTQQVECHASQEQEIIRTLKLMERYKANLSKGNLRAQVRSFFYRKRQGFRFLIHLALKRILLRPSHV